MRARAIKDLSQLSDTAFFLEAAEGLEHIISNARRLYDSAVVLAEAKHGHGYRVLMSLSEEEASKFLILVDAMRCPRQPADRFSNQLARFNDHLAKGGSTHGLVPCVLLRLHNCKNISIIIERISIWMGPMTWIGFFAIRSSEAERKFFMLTTWLTRMVIRGCIQVRTMIPPFSIVIQTNQSSFGLWTCFTTSD